MTGRAYNRGGKGGGRGGGRGQASTASPKPPAKEKTLEDYVFYVGSSKQASDYETTKDFVLNHIKQSLDHGKDIANAMRTLKKPDFDEWDPEVKASTNADPLVAEVENNLYQIKYKSATDIVARRVRAYNVNEGRAYGIVWARCAKAMQNKIASRTDYENVVYDDPIELMRAIKEHSLNFQETRYEMSIIFDAYRSVFACKQQEGESLLDYTRRFKTAKEILESQLGSPLILKKFVMSAEGFDETNFTKTNLMLEKASEQGFAFLYLENADQTKYGTILTNLHSQKSLGNDQFPKTIVETNNVLSNHKFDAKRTAANLDNKQYNPNQQKKGSKQQVVDESLTLSFAQMEGNTRCYCCGRKGHKSPECKSKHKIPHAEWAYNKMNLPQQHAQAKKADGKDGNENTPSKQKEETATGWTGLHCSFAQLAMKNLILLDSDSTDSVFCNRNYVFNIRNSGEPLDINTNGGVMRATLKCDLQHIKDVWFNEDSMTNIIALKDMTQKFRVTMDSSKEPALLVHMPNQIVKFKQFPNGLYAMDPNDDNSFIKKPYQFLQSVQENMKFLSSRQQERARRAHDLYASLGTPTMGDLKGMIRMNLIQNNVVTTEDVNLAMKVYGPDVPAIKGKTTRAKPTAVVSNFIEIPDELLNIQKDTTVSMDGLTVNSLKFLSTISHDLFYRTAQYVAKPIADVYKKCIDELLAVYKRGEFNITEIHCDNEFRKVMDPLSVAQNPPIKMNYVAAQEHVPRAERNNRVIQERVRAAYHRLPFTHLPRIMVKFLVMESTKKLNFFPNKHGVSKYFSPRMIMHQENLDYERHCKHHIGEYVQAHDEPIHTNTNAPRSLDCIYLRPMDSAQGGHELLHLQTNSVVKRRRLTKVPITPSIITQVHALAVLDGMPEGLKIKNRANLVIFDSAWIAGVDFDEQEFNDENYVEEENVERENDEDENIGEEYDEMDVNELADVMQETNEFRAPQETLEEAEPEEEVAALAEEEEEVVFEDEEPNQDEGVQQAPLFEHHEEDDEDYEFQDHEEDDEDYEFQDEEDIPLEADDEDGEVEDDQGDRRTGRVRVLPQRFQHLHAKEDQVDEYDEEGAHIIAKTINHFNTAMAGMSDVQSCSFLQTYSLKQGIRKFGEKGSAAAKKELGQLHGRTVFEPIGIEEMTALEKKRAMESLIFLNEKRDATIKARMCANGSTQRAYISREEASSPTAASEAIITTGVIDAKQGRDVMTLDIPNAFVQTPIDLHGDKVIMKIRGQLIDLLLEICPGVYDKYVVYEGNHRVLYVRMLKALYGMLISSLLFYKKFRADIESIGFEINPYDICVANRTVNGKQHTITWHVDDLKSSHIDPKVNDRFAKWCESTYGSDDLGNVKIVRGKVHDYLAMILDYTQDGALKLDMKYYIKGMLDDFPFDVKATTVTPWTERLLKVQKDAKKLDEERRSIFHTFVMKAMFLCKRARPDIDQAISFLSSRVNEANEGDWIKLLRVLGFLKGTIEDVLTLEADDTNTLTWYVDVAFAVHADMKSHTGAIFTMGKGAILSSSTKQKVNTRSSTESELVGVDDKISKVLWMKRFLEWQNFKVKTNIVYQDNTSTIKLAEKGKESSGKRTRHFEIKYFYVTDLVGRNEVKVIYCSTDEMVADYHTKPLTGWKFRFFRDLIMNLSGKHHRVKQQECVGRRDNSKD
jgi:hypothetical protein